MQSGRKEQYVQLFTYLKQVLVRGWHPLEVMADFEKGLRAAIREVYPNAVVKGCYFHYTQVLNFFNVF